MYSIARRFSRLMVLVGCSCCVAACEAVSTDTEALNKELVGKVSVGIKSVENSIPADQPMEVLFYLKNGTDAAIEILPWGSPCLLYTSPSPRDGLLSRMPSSA